LTEKSRSTKLIFDNFPYGYRMKHLKERVSVPLPGAKQLLGIAAKFLCYIPDASARNIGNGLHVDVDSVFEIAWLTLAHMMSEDPLEEHHGGSHEGLTGVMMTCRHCGDFFIRRNNRQEYCDKENCQKARNAKNQREFRNRKRMLKAGKKMQTEENYNGKA